MGADQPVKFLKRMLEASRELGALRANFGAWPIGTAPSLRVAVDFNTSASSAAVKFKIFFKPLGFEISFAGLILELKISLVRFGFKI